MRKILFFLGSLASGVSAMLPLRYSTQFGLEKRLAEKGVDFAVFFNISRLRGVCSEAISRCDQIDNLLSTVDSQLHDLQQMQALHEDAELSQLIEDYQGSHTDFDSFETVVSVLNRVKKRLIKARGSLSVIFYFGFPYDVLGAAVRAFITGNGTDAEAYMRGFSSLGADDIYNFWKFAPYSNLNGVFKGELTEEENNRLSIFVDRHQLLYRGLFYFFSASKASSSVLDGLWNFSASLLHSTIEMIAPSYKDEKELSWEIPPFIRDVMRDSARANLIKKKDFLEGPSLFFSEIQRRLDYSNTVISNGYQFFSFCSSWLGAKVKEKNAEMKEIKKQAIILRKQNEEANDFTISLIANRVYRAIHQALQYPTKDARIDSFIVKCKSILQKESDEELIAMSLSDLHLKLKPFNGRETEFWQSIVDVCDVVLSICGEGIDPDLLKLKQYGAGGNSLKFNSSNTCVWEGLVIDYNPTDKGRLIFKGGDNKMLCILCDVKPQRMDMRSNFSIVKFGHVRSSKSPSAGLFDISNTFYVDRFYSLFIDFWPALINVDTEKKVSMVFGSQTGVSGGVVFVASQRGFYFGSYKPEGAFRSAMTAYLSQDVISLSHIVPMGFGRIMTPKGELQQVFSGDKNLVSVVEGIETGEIGLTFSYDPMGMPHPKTASKPMLGVFNSEPIIITTIASSNDSDVLKDSDISSGIEKEDDNASSEDNNSEVFSSPRIEDKDN